jgi:sialate O-acetylesterase
LLRAPFCSISHTLTAAFASKIEGRGAFEIAGADHTWFPADAHLVNGVVVVSTSLVQQPTAVRYKWSTSAAATLFNSAGRPAAPFRTDE